jgi:hypothetical protein
MRVPQGGSMCANCRYVRGQTCTNKYFIEYYGTNKIPAPIDEYCSDWFEPRKSPNPLGDAVAKVVR